MTTKDAPKKILDFLEKQEWPVTTETVAAELKVSWNTSQVHLLKLVTEGKVKFRRVGRQNQFWLKRNYDREMVGAK